jgi:hypothetical protein
MARLLDNRWAGWLAGVGRDGQPARPPGDLRLLPCPRDYQSFNAKAKDSFLARKVPGGLRTREPRVPTGFALRNFHPAAVALFALIITGNTFAADPQAASSPGKQVEHILAIVHPGDATAKAVPHTLVQTLDADGNPSAYSMWVDSVICREKVCDVVKVQLHWDALGRYQHYQVALGSQLTKLDHVPFTQKDLAKLQEILSDTESPLREVEKEAMIAKAPAKPEKQVDGVAAVSQPTVLSLKTAVIIGAGYTCYDLWHWANGLLTQPIRDFSGKDSSKAKLLAYLASDDTEEAYFALQYLGKRQITDRTVFAAVIACCKEGDSSLVTPTLAYLRQAAPSDQVYFDSIVDLFSSPDSKKRLLILEDLTSGTRKPLAGFYDRLSDFLPSLESYFEVHRFLTLMETENPGSTKVARKAAELLKHQKFFVSRRAYWFLEKQQLPADLRKSAEEYFRENEDRL